MHAERFAKSVQCATPKRSHEHREHATARSCENSKWVRAYPGRRTKGASRTWASIAAFTEEVANARVYDGVHYRNSAEVGTAMGKKVGTLVVAKLAVTAANRPTEWWSALALKPPVTPSIRPQSPKPSPIGCYGARRVVAAQEIERRQPVQ